jgi:Tfp pilus assembly protein PilN
MVQFNLLPDIKIQYLKARRQKRLVLLASVIVSLVSLTVLIVLITTVFVVQKKSISDLSSDIQTASKELQGTKDLTKMLTVQNQLKVLPQLHEGKSVTSRIFGYITQSTPTAVSISRLNADFALQTLTLSGATDSLETINTFVDTLKFTSYHTKKDDSTEKSAFSSVVLSAFGRDSKGATYTITLKFDPVIFSELDEVTLTVPKKITTRSQTERPAALFQNSGGQ